MNAALLQAMIQSMAIGKRIADAVQAALESADFSSAEGQDTALSTATVAARNVFRDMGREPSERKLRFAAFVHVVIKLRMQDSDAMVSDLTDFILRHRNCYCRHPEIPNCEECPGHDA